MDKYVHYVFRTYKRKQILIDDVAKDLDNIFDDICKEKGFELIARSILVDHVHLLIRKIASDKNEYVMKVIKGASAYRVFRKYPSDRLELRKLWGRGYHAENIVDDAHLRKVNKYINEQKIEGVDKRIKV